MLDRSAHSSKGLLKNPCCGFRGDDKDTLFLKIGFPGPAATGNLRVDL